MKQKNQMKKLEKKPHDKLSEKAIRRRVTCKGTIGSIRAQHETMGFVLIIVIVSIIGVIFLGFMIRSEPESQKSIEISNLLQSAMYYTTDCAINYVPQYKEGQDLIKECYKNQEQKCLNELKVCDSLERNLKLIIDNGLRIDERGVNKAYKLDIYYAPLDEEGPQENIINLENGVFANCTSRPGGSHSIAISRFGYGNINIDLEVCKG